MTLSDGGFLIFFLILLQAGSLPCLVVTVCVMNHHMGRGAKPPKRTFLFFLGGRGADGRGEVRTGQDREENPSISSIYTHTHAHARAGRGRIIRNSDRWSLLFFVDSMRVEERLVGR